MTSSKPEFPLEHERLLEGHDEAGEPLRELLRSAAVDEPRPEQLERLASRLEPLLQAGAETALEGAGQAGSALGGAKAALWVGVAVVVGAGSWAALRQSQDTPPAASTAQVGAPESQQGDEPSVQEGHVDAEPRQTEAEPASTEHAGTEPTEAEAPSAERAQTQGKQSAERRSEPASSGAPTPTAPPEPEIHLLSQAQSALSRRDGAAALAIVQQHQQSYPRGVYGEEMQRIRIEALLLLGRRSEAAALAERFFERFPRSVHRQRIEALLGTGPTTPEKR